MGRAVSIDHQGLQKALILSRLFGSGSEGIIRAVKPQKPLINF